MLRGGKKNQLLHLGRGKCRPANYSVQKTEIENAGTKKNLEEVMALGLIFLITFINVGGGPLCDPLGGSHCLALIFMNLMSLL